MRDSIAESLASVIQVLFIGAILLLLSYTWDDVNKQSVPAPHTKIAGPVRSADE